MKNKFFFVGLSTIIILSIAINYFYNNSLKEQSILIYEFNNSGSLEYPLDLVKEFNHTFPDITVTTLPISVLKARYYLKAGKPVEGLDLIHQSRKANPYLGFPEYELARYYILRDIDSVLYYSRQAFHKLPRSDYHSKAYFAALAKLKKEQELDSAFSLVKKYNSFEQWKDYIFLKLEFGEKNRLDMQKLLDDNSNFDRTKDKYITLQTLVNVGFENYTDFQTSIIKAEAFFDQNRLVESAVIYDEVSVKNPAEYLLKENAAIAYYKAGMFDAAINSFQFVIDNFLNRKDAKAEFYLGLTYLTAKNKFQGCRYLTLAEKKNFLGAKKVKDKFCY
tara:strand:+ start:1278 stop:2279 length:1002 start_codon:yes stop_codon:yes gene_type:complete